jgi:plastocyanin
VIKNAIRYAAANLLVLTLTIGCSVAVQEEATAQAEPAKATVSADIEAGSIIGTVVFEGKAPKMRPVPVESDPHCVRLRDGKPLLTETLVLGEGQTMANVIVSVVSNLPKIDHPVPAEPVILSQEGCQYEPHVFALQAGQNIQIENPDGINHNVHLLPEKNKEMNRAMANAAAKFTYNAAKAEEPFVIKCDVHSWMKAYCAVFDHPYFAVTGLDGTFKIEGLPPGTYDVETWHEIPGLGTRRATVTIEEGKGAEIKFTYARPVRK